MGEKSPIYLSMNIGQNVQNIIAHTTNATAYASSESFMTRNVELCKRYQSLKNVFKNNFSGKVFVSNFYENIELPSFCNKIDLFKQKTIDDYSIILMNNSNFYTLLVNDVSREFKNNNSKSVIIVWDFDNHHWVSLSIPIALNVDLYVPAHYENLNLLSKMNSNFFGPVTSGTIQWKRSFIEKNIDKIINSTRSDVPLGHHIRYDQFPVRNSIVNTLNQHFSEIKLVNDKYHSLSFEERFEQWIAHKIHWIVPVANDAPIRVFDALITGGIPVLPKTILKIPEITNIAEHCVFYDILDSAHPQEVFKKALNKYTSSGTKGIKDRVKKGLENHSDFRILSILNYIKNEFDLNYEKT